MVNFFPDVLDMKNIDPQFTSEPVPSSIDGGDDVLSASVMEADEIFAGFAYAPPITSDLS